MIKIKDIIVHNKKRFQVLSICNEEEANRLFNAGCFICVHNLQPNKIEYYTVLNRDKLPKDYNFQDTLSNIKIKNPENIYSLYLLSEECF